MLELISKRTVPMFATLKLWMYCRLSDYGITVTYMTLGQSLKRSKRIQISHKYGSKSKFDAVVLLWHMPNFRHGFIAIAK
jgi:hypothetical protein